MPQLLEREIAQTKPLSLVDRAAANLHRSSAVLLQEVAAFLNEHGISPKQYNILRILRGAGEPGLSCREVTARLVTPDPDTTRLLDRLVAKKLVRRSHGRADRRVVMVKITAAGSRLLGVLEKRVQEIQNRQFQHLKTKELESLVTLLESLREPRES
jgi:DNA-binding MarR family transcriptional regulator